MAIDSMTAALDRMSTDSKRVSRPVWNGSRAVVRVCMDAGLVKGEGFAVDASVMEANASRYHGKAPDEIVWAEPERQTRAVREYLAGLEAENEPNPDRKTPKVISPSDPCSA